MKIYYFVSFSMPTHLIEQYLDDADRYGGTLVLRGIDPDMTLKQFVLKRLMPLLKNKKHKAEIIIDPKLFEKYNIKLVPTIVIRKTNGTQYKISGAVSTQWILSSAIKSEVIIRS